MTDYYDILGITEDEKKLSGDAFSDVVKKKYRPLAMKWHPDKWVDGTDEEKKAAEEKFKQISEANSVLSDPQKRQEYDYSNADFDPWEAMNANPFMRGFGMYNRPTVHKGDDITITISITLEEAYHGVKKDVTYESTIKCAKCNGTGAKDGKLEKCPYCNGTGMMSQRIKRGNMTQIISSPCPHCNGSGVIATEKCDSCSGSGTLRKEKKLTITLPRGIDNGMVFVIKGEGGDSVDGGQNGNLNVVVNVTNNTKFHREHNDLVYYDECHYSDALLGHEGIVELLDKTKAKFKFNELSKDGTEKRFSGKGMPALDQYGRNVGFGDLVIRIKCRYPQKLTQDDREAIKSLKHD